MLADNAAREPGLSQSTRDDLAQIEAAPARRHQLRNADADSLPERPAYQTLFEQVRDHLRHLHPTLALSVSGPEGRAMTAPPGSGCWPIGYNAIDAGAERLDVRLAALPGNGWLLQVSDVAPTTRSAARKRAWAWAWRWWKAPWRHWLTLTLHFDASGAGRASNGASMTPGSCCCLRRRPARRADPARVRPPRHRVHHAADLQQARALLATLATLDAAVLDQGLGSDSLDLIQPLLARFPTAGCWC